MFKLNSIRWRLALSYAAIALLASLILGLALRAVLRNYYDKQETRYLQERAAQVGFIVSQLINSNVRYETIQDQSVGWSYILQARVRIVDAAGNLIADSGAPDNPQMFLITSARPFQIAIEPGMELANQRLAIRVFSQPFPQNQAQGDEVIFISENSVGVAMPADVSMFGLFEASLGAPLRRSAQKVEQTVFDSAGKKIFTLTLSDGPAYGDEILDSVMKGWVVASIAAVLLAALAGWVISKRFAKPLIELAEVTSQMSQGNLAARAEVRGDDEIGLLGKSFNEMASRVEEMVGALRSFASDAAHELHTPLTALQTNLELALDESDGYRRDLYLGRAQEQGQRLEALTANLLNLSRIESTDQTSGFGLLNLSALLSQIAEQYASRAEQSNRIFLFDLPLQEIEIIGNETQLRQAFVNLFENAVKFTRVGDTIRISVILKDNGAFIEVADSGAGIPSDDLPNVFKRFHRGRNVSDIAGNGLGLAIVKAAVEAHGGWVNAMSAGPGRGSLFNVFLPIR